MKKREGFVSNSSSSSFVVVFPKEPTSWKDVKKMLFGDKKFHTYYDYTKSTDELAKYIREKMFEDGCKNNYEQAYELFSEDLPYNLACWEDENDKTYLIAAKKEFDKFFQSRKMKLRKIEGLDYEKDSVFYVFEFSDNGMGEIEVILEHGNVFEKLKHRRFSHH